MGADRFSCALHLQMDLEPMPLISAHLLAANDCHLMAIQPYFERAISRVLRECGTTQNF
jgi:hypothetical protein